MAYKLPHVGVGFPDNERVKSFFNDLPEKVGDNGIISMLRNGVTPLNGAIRAALPGHLKKFKSTLGAQRLKTRKPILSVGIYDRKLRFSNKRGVIWDAFTILYWHNYGTLSNRASGHNFAESRKGKTAAFKGGIRPLQFFESGANVGLPKAETKIMENAGQVLDKVAKKHGFV